jgi:hypothetical protein
MSQVVNIWLINMVGSMEKQTSQTCGSDQTKLHSPIYTARPPGSAVAFRWCFGALFIPLLFLPIPVVQRQVSYIWSIFGIVYTVPSGSIQTLTFCTFCYVTALF